MLVHGAGSADTSSWSGVIERLQAAGPGRTAHKRYAACDSGYLASVFEQIPGPVLAVGHSLCGRADRRRNDERCRLGLWPPSAPDDGERLGDLASQGQPTRAGAGAAPLSDGRGRPETAVEFAVAPARFHEVFAADLPASQAAVLAATQHSVSELAFSEPNGAPAWKRLPSWAVVATAAKAAGTDVPGPWPSAPRRRSPSSTAPMSS